MPVITPVAISIPAHEEHGVAVLPGRNWTAPSMPSTDEGAGREDQTAIESSSLSEENAPAVQSLAWVSEPARLEGTQDSKAAGQLGVFYFQVQRANLEADANEKAKSLDPTGHCYLVVGHADPSGPPKFIGPLSVERARSVARLLADSGATHADARGDGATIPRVHRDRWPKERRADVLGENCDNRPPSE